MRQVIILKSITHRSDPDARLSGLAVHLIPEPFDVIHRVYDEDRVSGDVSCDGGEECRAGGFFLESICLAFRLSVSSPHEGSKEETDCHTKPGRRLRRRLR